MNEQIKALLTARLTQLGTRYLAAFLVAKAGYDAAQADAATLCVVQVVVAALLFVLDQVISRFRSKEKIETAREEGKAEVIADAFPTKSDGRPWMQLALLPLLALTAVGCGAASPSVQVARQEQAFTLGLEAVNAGLRSGHLDKRDFVKLRPLVVAVNAYLDEAKSAALQVEVIKQQIADAATDEAKAALKGQLEVAQDQFTRVLRALTASLKALNAAQQEAAADVPAVPGAPAVQPPATAPAGPAALRVRQPADVRRARRGDWAHPAPAIAGA